MSLWSAITSSFKPMTSVGTSTMEAGNSSNKDTSTQWTPRKSMLPLIGGLLLVGTLFSTSVKAQTTYNSLTCNQTDVATQVALTVDGDTVTVPACPTGVTWTGQLSLTHAITLQGAGIGQTVIFENETNRGTSIINMLLVAGKVTRLTGFEFRDGTDGSAINKNTNGMVTVTGSNTNGAQFRIDHNKFNGVNAASIFTHDAIGVIDHNIGFQTQGARPYVFIFHQNWNGGTNSDGSFLDTAHFGTSQFVFMEDNTWEYQLDPATGFGPSFIVDAYRGARYVSRHDTAINAWYEAHGTDSGGRLRGTRAIEIYNNTFICNTPNSFLCVLFTNMRSATAVIHDNKSTGFSRAGGLGYIRLAAYRTFFPFGNFGEANGTSAYDINDPHGLYEQNTATSGGLFTLTRTGAGWTPHQWQGYSVIKVGCANPAITQCSSLIRDNTTDTITTYDDGAFAAEQGTPQLSFTTGDTYQIFRVLQVLDQPARGQGPNWVQNSDPPVPTANTQVTEPIYEWNNTATEDGADIGYDVQEPFQIRLGEHYFNNTQMPGYTPFTYPHPLTGAIAEGIPTTPVGLTVR